MAMYLKLEASNGKLPDFMSWSGQNVCRGFGSPSLTHRWQLFFPYWCPQSFAL